jgi:Phage Mu protein F like protein
VASINERFMDFQIAQQIRWIRVQNRDVQEALNILNRVDGQLELALRRAGIGDAPYTQARLTALKAQVTNLLSAMHSELDPVLTQNVLDAAEAAAKVEEQLFRQELPAGLDVTTPNLGVIQQAATLRPFNGAVMAEWVSQLKSSDLQRTWGHILDGIISGTTTDEIIRGLVGTEALNYMDGVRQVTRRGTEALVRTSINHATNQGRQMVWEANTDVVGSVRWVSTLDTRTTPICQHRDGRVGPVSEEGTWVPPAGASVLDPPMARPPAHPNCRSTTVAVTKSWRELGFDMDEMDPGTRASMDGQVPANMTYFEWLKKQSPEVQKDVLGKTRYDMWHKEGVTPDRFINDKGKYLTIRELKDLGPVQLDVPVSKITRLSRFNGLEGGLNWFEWKKDKNLEDYFEQLDATDFGLKAWPAVKDIDLFDADLSGAIGKIAVTAGRTSNKFSLEMAKQDLKAVLWDRRGLDGKLLHPEPIPLKIADAFDLKDFETARLSANPLNKFEYLRYLDPNEFGLKFWPLVEKLTELKGDAAGLLGDMRMVIINNAPGGKPKRYITNIQKRIDRILNPPKPVPITRQTAKDFEGDELKPMTDKEFLANEKKLGSTNLSMAKERLVNYQGAIAALRDGRALTPSQHHAYLRSKGIIDLTEIKRRWAAYQQMQNSRIVKTSRDTTQPKPFRVGTGQKLMKDIPALERHMQKAYDVMPNWVLNEIADVTKPTMTRNTRAFYNPWDGELHMSTTNGADVWVHEMFHALDFKYRYRGQPIGERRRSDKVDSLDWNTDDPNLNRLAQQARIEFKNRDSKGVGRYTHNKDGDYWLGDWMNNYEGRKYDFDIETSSEYITMGAQNYASAKMIGPNAFENMRNTMRVRQPAMLELLDYIWTRFD